MSQGKTVHQKPHRVPEACKKLIDEEVRKMLKLKVIEPSKSPWPCPVVMPSGLPGPCRGRQAQGEGYVASLGDEL